jgi:hypothetical protein
MDSAAAIFIIFLPFFDPALFRALALAEQYGLNSEKCSGCELYCHR